MESKAKGYSPSVWKLRKLLQIASQVVGSRFTFCTWYHSEPCIDALPHLKLIVQIDGTFLYGKYRGTLLIATSQDGDTHVVLFAFAIVEGENKEAWSWFLSNIRQHVVQERKNLCLISDRHGGILSAVADERVQWHPPYAHHIFCIRHLASNLNSEHKDPWLKKTLVNMGYELMPNRVEEMLAELRSHNQRAAEWIADIPKHQWCRSHDEGGRYDHMTTNLSECINGILKGARWARVRDKFNPPDGSLHYYRTVLDSMRQNEIIWRPYAANEIRNLIP
ncbi:uncharacterized protein G2W53_040838 [Senna tora]|uniref:MULE transposase domain-containing protein n=1 Tax=Senna tora TaxID=362788 RepID=A0A834VY98_9FABA|nr:uncharacterized protein G2W53_040838 [Senna tora]